MSCECSSERHDCKKESWRGPSHFGEDVINNAPPPKKGSIYL